jgi:hypothetical protein
LLPTGSFLLPGTDTVYTKADWDLGEAPVPNACRLLANGGGFDRVILSFEL